jgi:endogenous inhibitor of DNA gyrase (YacG/DUF329 family)
MAIDATPKSKAKCAVCGKLAVAEFRPFCSARCKQIDLGRWLNESYRVPAVEQDEDPAEEDDSGRN